MTSKLWPSIHSIHFPLQSRLKAFCGSIVYIDARIIKVNKSIFLEIGIIWYTLKLPFDLLCLRPPHPLRYEIFFGISHSLAAETQTSLHFCDKTLGWVSVQTVWHLSVITFPKDFFEDNLLMTKRPDEIIPFFTYHECEHQMLRRAAHTLISMHGVTFCVYPSRKYAYFYAWHHVLCLPILGIQGVTHYVT